MKTRIITALVAIAGIFPFFWFSAPVGVSSPAASDKRVVFPQPDGPIIPTNSRSFTEKDKSFTATVSPCFVW